MNFLDKIDKIKNVVPTGVSEKVSYTTTTMRLNSQFKNNENEIEQLIHQVGLQQVQLHLNDEHTEHTELFDKIKKLQTENQEISNEMQRLKDEQEEARQLELKRKQEQRELERQQEIERQQKREAEKAQRELERQQEIAYQQERQRKIDAATRICGRCGGKNENDAAFCVHCGNPFSTYVPVENS